MNHVKKTSSDRVFVRLSPRVSNLSTEQKLMLLVQMVPGQVDGVVDKLWNEYLDQAEGLTMALPDDLEAV